MDVRFADASLDRLETDASYDMQLSAALVKAFRKRMQAIRAAADERDFYAMKSWHFEKLHGKREGQNSIRLNDQFRLVLELEDSGAKKRVVIVAVEDYHG